MGQDRAWTTTEQYVSRLANCEIYQEFIRFVLYRPRQI